MMGGEDERPDKSTSQENCLQILEELPLEGEIRQVHTIQVTSEERKEAPSQRSQGLTLGLHLDISYNPHCPKIG